MVYRGPLVELGEAENGEPDELLQTRAAPIRNGRVLGGYAIGPLFAGSTVIIHRSCLHNEMVATGNRVVGKRPTVDSALWHKYWRISSENPFFQFPHAEPWSYEKWVARFPAHKRLSFDYWRFRVKSHNYTQRLLRKNNCFVKIEPKFANSYGSSYEEVVPRNIVSCQEINKVMFGPWCCGAITKLKTLWNEHSPIFLECGSSTSKVANWFNSLWTRFGSTWVVEVDFSRYDRTQSPSSFKILEKLFLQMGLRGQALESFKTQIGRQSGRTRRGGIFSRDSFMKTGVPNTTLGNSVLNAFMMASVVLDHGGVLGRDFFIMVRGDDSLSFIHPRFHKFLVPGLTQLGIKPKMKAGHRIHEIRFCSMAFYPTVSGKYFPAPTFKCLLKWNFTVKDIPEKQRLAHRRGVALGLLKQVNHVPLLRDYCQNELRLTQGAKGKYLKAALRDSKIKYLDVDEVQHIDPNQSYSYIASMYHLSVGMVLSLRDQISHMDKNGIYNSNEIEFLVRGVARVEG